MSQEFLIKEISDLPIKGEIIMDKEKTNDKSLSDEELANVSGGCVSREEELGGRIYVVPTSEVDSFVPHSSGDDVC